MNRLVKKAQRGDADAFIELIEMNKMTLQRVAFGYFRDEEDVADVIQDTILDAFEHLQELKKAEYFKTWLIRILMNNCNKLYNRNKNNCSLDEIPEKGTSQDASDEGNNRKKQTSQRKKAA